MFSSNGHSLALPALADAFERAIAAAEEARGSTAPNPAVGCAILDRSGAILAVEATRPAGGPHAEAAALAACRAAGRLDRIHTIVVTLEPCNHWGRTGPCTEAILASPTANVVIGTLDPNGSVAGGGLGRLRAAGLDVRFVGDVDEAAARGIAGRCADLVAPFAKFTATQRPWVTLKQALDPEGSMIPPPGATTFTSPAALRYAHELRRRADAVLTGSGTILADDPAFTVRRVADHPGRWRHLAILDRRRRVPRRYLDEARGRHLLAFVADDLDTALERLGQADVLEVLIEAGPALTAGVLDRGLWDEHVVIRKSREPDAADRVEIRRPDGRMTTRVLA